MNLSQKLFMACLQVRQEQVVIKSDVRAKRLGTIITNSEFAANNGFYIPR